MTAEPPVPPAGLPPVGPPLAATPAAGPPLAAPPAAPGRRPGWSRRRRFLAALPGLIAPLLIVAIGTVTLVEELTYYRSLPPALRALRLVDGDTLSAGKELWLGAAIVVMGLIVLAAPFAVVAPPRLSRRLCLTAAVAALAPLGLLTIQALQGPGPGVAGNWAGYVAVGDDFTRVTASWTQPAFLPSGAPTSAAFWVGIDGEDDTPVEQIGTEGFSENGLVSYDAWYEMYPAPVVQISVAVHAGDTLEGTVSSSAPHRFTLRLVDVTTGASYTTTQTNAQAARSSAEVVAETPSDSEIRLADFLAVRFRGCAINGLPIGMSLYHRYDLTSDRHVVEAATSALGDSGSSFSVTPTRAAVAASGGLWRDLAAKLTFRDVAAIRVLVCLSLAYTAWLGLLRLNLQRRPRRGRRIRALAVLPGLLAPAIVVALGAVAWGRAWTDYWSVPSALRGLQMAGGGAADTRLLDAAAIVGVGLALCLAPLAVTVPRRLSTWCGVVAVVGGAVCLGLMVGRVLPAGVYGAFDLALFVSLAYTPALGLWRLRRERHRRTAARLGAP